MKKFSKIISAVVACTMMASFASVNVSAADVSAPTVVTASADEAANAVMAEGITAKNASIDVCAGDYQVATFAVPDAMGLPFSEGLLLTTGNSTSVFQSSISSATLGNSGDGDADLTEIYNNLGFSGSTNDAVKLSFELVPTASDLTFDFFFASTEYNQPISFNDVFALWIIDSETGEKFNVAKTPFGKVVNVDNTVTKDADGNRTYTESSKYYNYVSGCNLNGYDFGVQGITTMFTANASDLVNSNGNKVIQAGKPVKVCFAIADCGDSIRDSIIFIRGNSLEYKPVEKKEFTVTFDANGGSCDVASAVTGTDGTLETLPEAVFEEHVFDGWYTKASGGKKVDVTTVFEQDTTVYAHWTAETYTITFDTDGGNAVEAMVYNNESTDTIPSAEKSGYNFAGWTVVSGDGNWEIDSTVEAGKSLTGMYGNVTLKAEWEEIPTTVPETTVEETTVAPATATADEPTVAPTTNASTADEAPEGKAVQTGSSVPSTAILMVLLAGIAVAYYARKRFEV